jgi:hypothetical protein
MLYDVMEVSVGASHDIMTSESLDVTVTFAGASGTRKGVADTAEEGELESILFTALIVML